MKLKKITPHKADCQRYNGVMKAVITPEIAENLHQVGDRWTLLILRDLFLGRNRFETLKAKTGAGERRDSAAPEPDRR